ncbi:MAG TPA: hypothetical protein DEQ43_05790 [Nocardioides bacterium]|uniref:WXG100 family type VII secretion target n=1 Tax=uncultured Nocardioides sp. TaxID=198441 RepID=UPI000ECEA7E7|nr:WXG100 family type VII secretion target [uncultured Nocardioides sp.]HCB03751.1 hypothetical protein [Nocardioides sp.]HRD63162.1 WXG100 family type VII secretion target [Nocardioides sp.]HRK45676.1 WXG100 family type VII secretion target [Nocardioides sp.]
MSIEFSHPEFVASVAEVRHAASQLSEARARASGQVSDLLRSWHGAAAEAFAEGWSDWQAASASVTSTLARLADDLEQFRSLLTSCDDGAAAELAHLAGRLS